METLRIYLEAISKTIKLNFLTSRKIRGMENVQFEVFGANSAVYPVQRDGRPMVVVDIVCESVTVYDSDKNQKI